MKLFKDFGVRALLATISLICYEGALFLIVILLWKAGTLDSDIALTIIPAAQSPALAALAFYFGTKSTPPAGGGN